jgi:nitroimidazol reductase NimA-like FMN-containing flavoprotein (pyridoxamine 5'-phosphate oxidase superfamily)
MDHLSPEVVDFLSTGTRTGKLAWTAADGRPLVAPVWFVVEDGAVLFNTGKETAKGRAIHRDSPAGVLRRPRGAAVCVRAGAGHCDDQ